jgi:hypothetical protein
MSVCNLLANSKNISTHKTDDCATNVRVLVSLGFRSTAAQFRRSNDSDSGFQIVSYIKHTVFFCSKQILFQNLTPLIEGNCRFTFPI